MCLKEIIMKMSVVLSLVSVLFGANAMADFQLSQNQKPVVCYGEDNQSVNLNAKRTTLKYTVEGETQGALKIVDVQTDGKTFVKYTTSEYSLTLSDAGDLFFYNGDQEPGEFRCK
jgi:ribosomal protein L25 (general stress protein Ctc)